jgi:hypothetical protein
MTLKEREEEWTLRTELKKKREESAANRDGAIWIIRKNKIINIRKTHQEDRD